MMELTMKTNTAESKIGSQSEARETKTTIVPPSDENRQEPKCWERQMSNEVCDPASGENFYATQTFGPRPIDKIKIGGKTMPATTKVQAVPTGYHTVTPYFTVKGAAKLIDFLKKAFKAEERFRMPGPNG